ncbi:MAG: hypothetical protein ACI3ZR_03965 [bacterium]
MAVLFGNDIISKHYELLHYIMNDNQIISRYLAEKLGFDYTISLEDLYIAVIEKLDVLEPLDNESYEYDLKEKNNLTKMVYMKDYLEKKQERIN